MIKVKGDKEIIKRLKRLDTKTRKKVIRKATRQVAKTIVLPEARSRVPVDSGALKRSLKVRALRRSRTAIGARVITGEGFFKGDEFYGGFVEYGYHVGKRGLAGRTKVAGQHFMRDAYESRRDAGKAALRRLILKEIELEAKKK